MWLWAVLVVVAMLGLVLTMDYGCDCVVGNLIFFFFLSWAVVATWRLLLVE